MPSLGIDHSQGVHPGKVEVVVRWPDAARRSFWVLRVLAENMDGTFACVVDVDCLTALAALGADAQERRNKRPRRFGVGLLGDAVLASTRYSSHPPKLASCESGLKLECGKRPSDDCFGVDEEDTLRATQAVEIL